MERQSPLEEVLDGTKALQQQQQQEKRVRSSPEQALKCPRCDSTNTKFCYYNNYSLSQPRYFCKGCRRYWTQGGSLRNVPVGGGCRKNRRCSSSSLSSSSTAATAASASASASACSHRTTQDPQALSPSSPSSTTTNSAQLLSSALPAFSYDPNDLTLAFARLQQRPPTMTEHDAFLLGNPNFGYSIRTPPPAAFLDIFRGGFLDASNGNGSNYHSAGFHNVLSDLGTNGINADHHDVECGGRGLFGIGLGEVGVGGSSGATAATKQEPSCKGVDGDTKVVMGLQWQQDANMVVDTGRDYWGSIGSSWHGLINSSLM